MRENKTVRVRIAVAVGPDGDYGVCPIVRSMNDTQAFEWAQDCVDGDPLTFHVVEATLTRPMVETVEGEVSDA